MRRDNSATNASEPPSPLLSALISRATYWIETTRVIDQKMRLTTPSTCRSSRASGCGPTNVSRNAYRGLVPISPNTIPIAPTASFSLADLRASPWDELIGI
jgi:hypothetical protein